jgi:hypothetical protein
MGLAGFHPKVVDGEMEDLHITGRTIAFAIGRPEWRGSTSWTSFPAAASIVGVVRRRKMASTCQAPDPACPPATGSRQTSATRTSALQGISSCAGLGKSADSSSRTS